MFNSFVTLTYDDDYFAPAIQEWMLYSIWCGDDEQSPNYGAAQGHLQTFFSLLQVKSNSDVADKAFNAFKNVFNDLNNVNSGVGGGAGRKPKKDELEYKPGKDFIGSKNIELWKGKLN